MKKAKTPNPAVAEVDNGEMLPEYDFTHARSNEYAARYPKGSLTITLDPEVAAVFPSSTDANEALRSLARLLQAQQKLRANKVPGA